MLIVCEYLNKLLANMLAIASPNPQQHDVRSFIICHPKKRLKKALTHLLLLKYIVSANYIIVTFQVSYQTNADHCTIFNAEKIRHSNKKLLTTHHSHWYT